MSYAILNTKGVVDCMRKMIFFFFFQAEDGIRDWSVTGVQTCALPISPYAYERHDVVQHPAYGYVVGSAIAKGRSEEHTSELQSLTNLVCRLLLEKKKK